MTKLCRFRNYKTSRHAVAEHELFLARSPTESTSDVLRSWIIKMSLRNKSFLYTAQYPRVSQTCSRALQKPITYGNIGKRTMNLPSHFRIMGCHFPDIISRQPNLIWSQVLIHKLGIPACIIRPCGNSSIGSRPAGLLRTNSSRGKLVWLRSIPRQAILWRSFVPSKLESIWDRISGKRDRWDTMLRTFDERDWRLTNYD